MSRLEFETEKQRLSFLGDQANFKLNVETRGKF